MMEVPHNSVSSDKVDCRSLEREMNPGRSTHQLSDLTGHPMPKNTRDDFSQ